MKKPLSTAVIVALLAGTGLRAAPVLDFNIDGVPAPNGSISTAGGVAPLVAVGIGVDTIAGIGTPANGGVPFAVTAGVLSFTTGAGLGGGMWGPGGAISITGAVAAAGAGPGTLLSGSILSAQVVPGGPSFKVAIAVFVNQVDAALAAFFGLPGGIGPNGWPYHGSLNLSFDAPGSVSEPFASTTVLSGDVVTTPVPEPVTILLLGSGSIGLAALARRRQSRKAAA